MSRIYLIGAGAIARHHAAALATLPPQLQLIVTDTNQAMLDEFLQQFPHAQPAASVPAMLADPATPDDIVIVATPPAAHYPLARLALESGRHVLCEKPLVMNLSQADELLALARAQNRLLGCCSTRFLGLPTTAEVKRLLREHELGELYHLTFVQRAQRARPGIEYQPRSRWFLDRTQSGGGPLMDWGPYDFAALNDVLAPVRVDVVHAWLSRPRTAADPLDVVFDIEEHVGASLRYHLADKTIVQVMYERAACTHGEPRSVLELEGTAGAVRWDWLMWGDDRSVSVTKDQDGQPTTTTTQFEPTDQVTFHERPLVYFYRQTQGQPSPALVNEQAVFNFACIQAIYACVASGQPQSVVRS
jgi:predicted dehydrogenase